MSDSQIGALLSADHDRLDALLRKASADPRAVDVEAYEAFRRGLLRHVGMEEMILIPAARRADGVPLAELAARIRLDHGALTALLVPSPTPRILRAVTAILEPHNRLEEGGGEGLYDACARALGAQAGIVFERLRQARDIPPAAHADGPTVMAVVRRALAAAGHEGLL